MTIKIFHDHNCLLTYTKKGVLPGEADEAELLSRVRAPHEKAQALIASSKVR